MFSALDAYGNPEIPYADVDAWMATVQTEATGVADTVVKTGAEVALANEVQTEDYAAAETSPVLTEPGVAVERGVQADNSPPSIGPMRNLDTVLRNSKTQIGTTSYGEFLTALADIGSGCPTKEDIASAFLKMANVENANLGVVHYPTPKDIQEVLNSRSSLRQIKVGTITLGVFLDMVENTRADVPLEVAWMRASEDDQVALSR